MQHRVQIVYRNVPCTPGCSALQAGPFSISPCWCGQAHPGGGGRLEGSTIGWCTIVAVPYQASVVPYHRTMQSPAEWPTIPPYYHRV